jgi:hypothetical protein
MRAALSNSKGRNVAQPARLCYTKTCLAPARLLERTTTVTAAGFTPRPVLYVAMICEPVSGCGFIFPRKDSLAIVHEGPWVLLLVCCAAVCLVCAPVSSCGFTFIKWRCAMTSRLRGLACLQSLSLSLSLSPSLSLSLSRRFPAAASLSRSTVRKDSLEIRV